MKLALAALILAPFCLSAAAQAETVFSCKDRLYTHEYNEIIEVTISDEPRLTVEYKNKKGKVKTDIGTYDWQKRKFIMADAKGTDILMGTAFRNEGDGLSSEIVFYYFEKDAKPDSRKRHQSIRCKKPLPKT